MRALLIGFIVFFFQGEPLTTYQTEWYSIQVLSKSWKYNNLQDTKISRTSKGLDTSWTSFVPANRKDVDDCGFVFSIRTYIHPQQAKINADSAFYQDSVSISRMKGLISYECSHLISNGSKIRTIFDKSEDTHPGTGALFTLNHKTWYIEGKRNLYIISFSSCNFFQKYLPLIEESVLPSFKEK